MSEGQLVLFDNEPIEQDDFVSYKPNGGEGYEPSHPWYYSMGGMPILPKDIAPNHCLYIPKKITAEKIEESERELMNVLIDYDKYLLKWKAMVDVCGHEKACYMMQMELHYLPCFPEKCPWEKEPMTHGIATSLSLIYCHVGYYKGLADKINPKGKE